jgi:hypothetical protein
MDRAPEVQPLARIGNADVFRDGGRESATRLWWTSGFRVDADGAPDAYSPTGGRDALGNAGHPGNWWGIMTDTGRPSGQPIVQGPRDPSPGAYVSTTALCDHRYGERDPRRYVDSARVPYLSIPRELLALGVTLGDLACVSYKGNWCPAIVGDVGPSGRIGEGSIYLAAQLGIDSSPRHGGVGAGVLWEVYLHTSAPPAWPRGADEMLREVQRLSGRVPVCV